MPNTTIATNIITKNSGTPTELDICSDILLMSLKIVIITFPTELKAFMQSDLTRSEL